MKSRVMAECGSWGDMGVGDMSVGDIGAEEMVGGERGVSAGGGGGGGGGVDGMRGLSGAARKGGLR